MYFEATRSGRNRFPFYVVNSALCYISALAALSNFLVLALSRHGAFRSQIIGHRTRHLSLYCSLFLWTAIALSLSLELLLTVCTRQPSRINVLSSVESLFLPPSLSLYLSLPCFCAFRLSVGWTTITPSGHTRNAEQHSRHVGRR